MSLCADIGPGCQVCGAPRVHCLLPEGHDGDHEHDPNQNGRYHLRCRPIRWPRDTDITPREAGR